MVSLAAKSTLGDEERVYLDSMSWSIIEGSQSFCPGTDTETPGESCFFDHSLWVSWLPYCIAQAPPAQAWYCPQWIPSPTAVNNQEHSLTDMPIGQSDRGSSLVGILPSQLSLDSCDWTKMWSVYRTILNYCGLVVFFWGVGGCSFVFLILITIG